MAKRIAKLRLALYRAGGVDVVVTHAPPSGLGDGTDPAHRGFACFQKLLDRYHPLCLLHGHVHMRGYPLPERELVYDGTRIINVSERYVLDLPDRSRPSEDPFRLRYITKRKTENGL